MVTRAAGANITREGGAGSDAGEEACRIAWEAAYNQARRRGLDDEAARECAQAFVTHLIERGLYNRHRDMEALRFAAWLHRCLANSLADAGRAQARREKHEAAWPETESEGGTRVAWECAGSGPSPEAGLLRDEFWAQLMAALQELPRDTLGMFLRHYLDEVPVRDLATAAGRPTHGVEQALHRLRKRLRTLLEGTGLGEAELRAYIEASWAAESEQPHPTPHGRAWAAEKPDGEEA